MCTQERLTHFLIIFRIIPWGTEPETPSQTAASRGDNGLAPTEDKTQVLPALLLF